MGHKWLLNFDLLPPVDVDSHLALDVLLEQALVHAVHLHTVAVVVVIHHVSAKVGRCLSI